MASNRTISEFQVNKELTILKCLPTGPTDYGDVTIYDVLPPDQIVNVEITCLDLAEANAYIVACTGRGATLVIEDQAGNSYNVIVESCQRTLIAGAALYNVSVRGRLT